MTEKAVEENTTLVQKVTEGGEYFAVAHIFASFNDTFVVSSSENLFLFVPF
jgi:ribosomal protein S11